MRKARVSDQATEAADYSDRIGTEVTDQPDREEPDREADPELSGSDGYDSDEDPPDTDE